MLQRIDKPVKLSEMEAPPQRQMPSVTGEIAIAGAMTAAKASGFGVYQGMSIALHGAGNAVGATLPFAAYTGTASAMSLALGPIGWSCLGAVLLWKLLR
jgi:uncharacterized protein YaaW (UPF0174 family)